jgi:hypothetical protein
MSKHLYFMMFRGTFETLFRDIFQKMINSTVSTGQQLYRRLSAAGRYRRNVMQNVD